MTDNTNDQDLQNNSSNPQNSVPQNNSQQETNENTYWESNSPNQTVEQPTQEQKTTEQINQYYQQQLNDIAANQQYQQTNYNQTEDSVPRPPKKKSHVALAIILVLLFVLGAAAGTAYAFKDTITNSLAKMTKSPVEYYAYIETNYVKDTVDKVTPYIDKNSLAEKKAYNTTADITVNHDAVDSLLQSSLGMSLTDLESMVGIKLETIGVDALVGTDGNNINETIGLRLNNVNLITAELFFNLEAKEALLRLPELSKAYLSLTDEAAVESLDMSSLKLFTSERVADLLTRYSNIIINNINQVTIEEDVPLSLNTISTKCTKLVATITADDMSRIGNAILEEAKTDSFIIELLPMYNITKEEYIGYIDDAIAELQSNKDTLDIGDLQMVVYVDSKGNIIGREITSADSVAAFGYTLLSKKSETEYNVYLTDDTGADILDITGNQTYEDGSFDGKAKVTVGNTGEAISDFSFDITYEDLRDEEIGNNSYQYGNITFSSLDLMGIQVIMDFNVEEEQQTCKVDVQMGAESLVTINSKTKYLEDYEVVTPPENAEIYTTTQAESYLATFNLNDYITNLSDKLGVDLQGLFGSFIPDSTY